MVGSTSETETPVAPGGATEVAGAEPAGTPAGQNGVPAGQNGVSKRQRWLRRTKPAAGFGSGPAKPAPSVVSAGPDLDLASNDPLVGYLLSAASTDRKSVV